MGLQNYLGYGNDNIGDVSSSDDDEFGDTVVGYKFLWLSWNDDIQVQFYSIKMLQFCV